MSHLTHLDWPFFEDRHRALATELDAWATAHVPHAHGSDVDAECRALVKSLGAAGWLRHAVGGTAHGGAAELIDTRPISRATTIPSRISDFVSRRGWANITHRADFDSRGRFPAASTARPARWLQ